MQTSVQLQQKRFESTLTIKHYQVTLNLTAWEISRKIHDGMRRWCGLWSILSNRGQSYWCALYYVLQLHTSGTANSRTKTESKHWFTAQQPPKSETRVYTTQHRSRSTVKPTIMGNFFFFFGSRDSVYRPEINRRFTRTVNDTGRLLRMLPGVFRVLPSWSSFPFVQSRS